MSKRSRVVAVVLGSLLALVLVAIGIIRTPWVQAYLKQTIISNVERATGARLEIRQFRFQPLHLLFTFEGVVLHGTEPAPEPPFFSAKSMTLQLSPKALWQWRSLFRSVEWNEAEIHLYTHPDASLNFPEPLRPSEGGFEAERLTFSRTSFYWNSRRLGADLSAVDLVIAVRGTAPGVYSGSISTTQVQIQSPALRLPPVSVEARLELSRLGLHVTSYALRGAGMQVNGKLRVSRWRSPETDLSYEASGDVGELTAILGRPQLRRGMLESRGTFTYRAGGFAARGTVRVQHVTIASPQVAMRDVSISSDFEANSERVQFRNIEGTGWGGTLRGSGEVAFTDSVPAFVFRAGLSDVDVERALESFLRPAGSRRPPRFASLASGSLTVNWKGAFDELRTQFQLELKPPAVVRARSIAARGALKGTARLTPDIIVRLETANLRSPNAVLSARGTIGARGASLALEITANDIEEWKPALAAALDTTGEIPLRLKSEAKFRGEVSGPLSTLLAHGELASGPFEFRGSKWDSLRADISLSQEAVRVNSALLKYQTGDLRLKGNIPLRSWKFYPEGPFQLSMNSERARIEGLLAAVGVQLPLAGNLTGSLVLDGTPAVYAGEGAVRVDNGTLHGEPFNSLTGRIRVDKSTWQVRDLEWTKGEGIARGEVEVALPDRAIRAHLKGENFRLADIQRLKVPRPKQTPETLQGSISFEIQASGRLQDVALQVLTTVRNVVVAGAAFGDLRTQVRWEGRALRVEGEAEGPGGRLRFAGGRKAGGDAPLELDGEFASLRLDPWLHLVSGQEPPLELVGRGTFGARIPFEGPKGPEFWGQAQELTFRVPELSWKNAEPVRVQYVGGRLTVDRFRLQGSATNLEVGGWFDFGQERTLSLLAEGTAEATLLTLLDPAIQAHGRSALKMRVAGSLERPLVNGRVEVQDVSLGYGDLPFRITGLKGEIALEGDRATLRSLRGTSGGGMVTLDGFAVFGKVSRFNVRADLNQVRLRYPTDFTSLMDGSLRLTGNAQRGEISGELTVRQVFAPENFNWLARVANVAQAVELGQPAIPSPVAPHIRLNVRVNSAPAVRFETRGAERLRLVADIDLRVQGTLAVPVLTGTIQILSGEAVFRGNPYTITRGDISMTNPFRTDPVLGLEARTRVQRYDLTVNIAGPFDRLKITYRSDPPLPTADIITLLALGYARQEQEMATGTTHPVTAVGTSALISQALSTQVSGRIQRLFGVSRIKIDPNVGGIGGTGGARITVEQRVAPELTLTYVTNTGTSQYRIIRLEWAVTDRVSVIGERDQGGIFGMEVHFRQRFK